MKGLLIGIVVVVLLVAAVGFFLPTAYSIEESVTIDAPPAQVHAFVGDLKKWPEWAPWYEEDPTILTTYGEKTTGVGASQTWTAEDGDGELTLTRSDVQTGIAYEMAFLMGETRAPADCAMSYAVEGGRTTVTWTMTGDLGDMMPPVVAGYMRPLLQKQIGSFFVDGLQTLKSKVEAAPLGETTGPAEAAAAVEAETTD